MVRQAQAREQEKNEDSLGNLSEIQSSSVPPKYKLFHPVFDKQNKQKGQSNETHVNCKSKSLLVKLCFELQ